MPFGACETAQRGPLERNISLQHAIPSAPQGRDIVQRNGAGLRSFNGQVCTGASSDGGGAPQGRSCIQAPNVTSLLHDDSRTNEADA
jgi:hypothetical protein